MKKLKKNQLKLDKEIISSLSENELSVVKGGVYTEPLTHCQNAKTLCMQPAPSLGICPSFKNTECCFESQICVKETLKISCGKACEPSVDICMMTDKC